MCFSLRGDPEKPKAKPGEAYSIKELLTEVDKVAARWKASCGTEVDVWHSDFMENMEPGHWVIFTVLEEEKNRALAMVGSDRCSQGGYLKEGSMVITGFQQWCMSEPDACQ